MSSHLGPHLFLALLLNHLCVHDIPDSVKTLRERSKEKKNFNINMRASANYGIAKGFFLSFMSAKFSRKTDGTRRRR